MEKVKKPENQKKSLSTRSLGNPSLKERKNTSYHLAANKIPQNPKTGFTNISGIGGMTIGYIDVPEQTDFTPFFKGLPHDMCCSPHWGYILEGTIRLIYPGGKEETINAGEVFYWPAPHTAVIDKSVKFIDFSPDKEMSILMDHFVRIAGGDSSI